MLKNGPRVDLNFRLQTDSRVTSADQNTEVAGLPASMSAVAEGRFHGTPKLCTHGKRLILSLITDQRSAEFNQNFE